LNAAVGAIAIVGELAAARCVSRRIDVLGRDLRAEVAGDVGVGNRDAVDQPAYLMSAADVRRIVREIKSGRDIVGDHSEAVGLARRRCFVNLQAVGREL